MDVDVIEGRFEDWRPEAGKGFDLVIAATAWNWVDPEVRYIKAWQVLRPGGHLAFWNAAHVFPNGGDPFFREIQNVYDEIGEGNPEGTPRPGELHEQREEIEKSGLFDVVHIRHFDWERIYHVEEYIKLLKTFSGHILMEEWKRDMLFNEIRVRLNRRPEKSVRRHWGAVLHVARRKD
jgi:SAM-dependent methyltransferase